MLCEVEIHACEPLEDTGVRVVADLVPVDEGGHGTGDVGGRRQDQPEGGGGMLVM